MTRAGEKLYGEWENRRPPGDDRRRMIQAVLLILAIILAYWGLDGL